MKTSLRLAFLILAALAGGRMIAQTQAKTTPPTPPAQAAPPQKKAAGADETIPPPGPNALFPAVVARVNGKPVLGVDLERRVRNELAAIGSPAWKDLRDDYRAEVTSRLLGELVGDELLYQKAVASGMTASAAEIQTEFDKVYKTYPSDAAFNTELANRGMDRITLSRELEKNLVLQKYIEEDVRKKLTVTPAELTDYYNKNVGDFKHPDLIRTSHILIVVPDNPTEEQEKMAKARAEAIAERAKKGEDFAKLAKENSMDGSASQGGDIGLTEIGQLAPEYEEAAAKLKVGEVSGPVRTQFGYHVIKLTDRKKAGTATLDEVRDDLTEFLKSQKEDETVSKLIKTLQGQAKIEILIPFGS